MKDKVKILFLSEKGSKIKELILSAIDDYRMSDMIEGGVLVGFSGGADSVMLLSFLAYYSDFGKRFPVVAVHINHCIRGEEADRDEAFAKDFCDSLSVEFISHRIDVPALSREEKIGTEECARKYRYREFMNIIQGRSDIGSICVAHNADDNLETVILNMVRGCGTRGMAGIPPIRENIVRPLLYVKKADIVSALSESGIDFVIDSTNLVNDYKRNFVRNEILPKFREISDSPEIMAARASRNLRTDDDYIGSVAEEFIGSRKAILNFELASLHDAVFTRVLSAIARTSISSVNIREIRGLLKNDNFAYSLPEGKSFVCEYGVCRVTDDLGVVPDYYRKLSIGINDFEDFDSDVIISSENAPKTFTNVYKISIQANLASAIIEGDLYLRAKKDGDVIKYGGMTHKLKKLFNDRKIPPSYRGLVPIVCDGRGVLYVPGFGVRDDNVDPSERKNVFVTIGIGKGNGLKDLRFYLGNEVFK